MSTAKFIIGYLGGALILAQFIWIGFALYVARNKLDLILKHLPNCPAITSRAPLRHGGLLGKALLIGGISGMVTFPGFYLKRGGLNLDDLNSLPQPIKRELKILQWGLWALLIPMPILFAIHKSGWIY